MELLAQLGHVILNVLGVLRKLKAARIFRVFGNHSEGLPLRCWQLALEARYFRVERRRTSTQQQARNSQQGKTPGFFEHAFNGGIHSGDS